jgi:hypothetical protein
MSAPAGKQPAPIRRTLERRFDERCADQVALALRNNVFARFWLSPQARRLGGFGDVRISTDE